MTGFASLIDQHQSIEILAAILQKGTIPHALLFTGIEGIGKQAAAMAFAMARNCSNIGNLPAETYPDAPNQDKWIARNRESLPTVKLALGVGGSLDFVTGKAHRAPRWVQNLGLEWLHRLILEPWRWRRMLALPRFALKVLLTPRS